VVAVAYSGKFGADLFGFGGAKISVEGEFTEAVECIGLIVPIAGLAR
jgi:hypothetical protein